MVCRPDRYRGGEQAAPLQTARAALLQEALPRPVTIVVGVSGGADSLALALVLVRLAPEMKLRLVAAHYDHGVRDAASCMAERAMVRRQAQRLGLTLREGSAPGGQLLRRRRATGRSLEDLAREQRYAFLLDVAADSGACAVAVGHHRDDDLETILMRALQGSLRGGGIPRRSGLVLRPLLGVRRAALRRYVADAGLPVLEDPTNADQRMLRNRIRRLLPALEAAVPGTAGNLPRLAAGAAAAWRRIQQEARREVPWRYACEPRRGVHYRVAAATFWAAAVPVREAALYQACDAVLSRGRSVRHERPRLPRRFLQPLLQDRPASGRLRLDGHGVRIACDRERVLVARHAHRQGCTAADPAG